MIERSWLHTSQKHLCVNNSYFINAVFFYISNTVSHVGLEHIPGYILREPNLLNSAPIVFKALVIVLELDNPLWSMDTTGDSLFRAPAFCSVFLDILSRFCSNRVEIIGAIISSSFRGYCSSSLKLFDSIDNSRETVSIGCWPLFDLCWEGDDTAFSRSEKLSTKILFISLSFVAVSRGCLSKIGSELVSSLQVAWPSRHCPLALRTPSITQRTTIALLRYCTAFCLLWLGS